MTGSPPSPRTFHTSSAAIGNQLYVFGGGERGAQPVQDVKLHVFDASMGWGHRDLGALYLARATSASLISQTGNRVLRKDFALNRVLA